MISYTAVVLNMTQDAEPAAPVTVQRYMLPSLAIDIWPAVPAVPEDVGGAPMTVNHTLPPLMIVSVTSSLPMTTILSAVACAPYPRVVVLDSSADTLVAAPIAVLYDPVTRFSFKDESPTAVL